jgi:DNA-directed RNA polymerase subunit M/transcription elongation factor TFIIS
MTPRLGGLGASKYSDIKPASLEPPASNQKPAKNAVVNEPDSSWVQPPGLGRAVNLEDYQGELHCIVCVKSVTVEFQFDYGKKFYLWELHHRDFHGKCPDCHKMVRAIWDDKINGHDFSEHRKVCIALPAGWAICKFCHEKTFASLISTPEGRIRDFSKHNTTCPAKAEEKTVLFHCKSCGIGVTNKSDFYDNHSKACFERACVNNTVDAFDEKTGARKPPTTHFHCKNCGMGVTDKKDFFKNHKQSCDVPASERRPALPLFGSRGAYSPTNPQSTAAPSWQGNVTNYQSQRAGPSQPNTTNTPPQTGTSSSSSSERRPPMPSFGGKAWSRPKIDDGPQWQGNVIKY